MDKWFSSNFNAGLGEVNIFGEIGGFGVYADEFISEVQSLGATRLRVNISSLGGDTNQAFQIHDFLKSYKGKVTARVTGFTASAGTLIAMGADVVEMSENSLFLVHNSWTMEMGNAEEMREKASELDTVDDIQVRIYKAKTGMTEEAIRELMAEERWMSPEEAKEKGFVDKVTSASEISAISLEVVYAKIDSKELPDANFNIKNTNEMAEKTILETINAKFEELSNTISAMFGKNEEEQVETIAKADAEELVTKAKAELETEYKFELSEKEDAINAKVEEISAKIAEVESLNAKVAALEAELAKAKAGKVETPKADEEGSVETPKAQEVHNLDALASKYKF
jgi:ATP-dependent protease ClpP protease subunit/outer membrane murein-binding lipoprotein Lpp